MIPADNEDDDSGQENVNFEGTQELNGIFIKELDNAGFGPGKRVTQGNIEETKINFFDPKLYDD